MTSLHPSSASIPNFLSTNLQSFFQQPLLFINIRTFPDLEQTDFQYQLQNTDLFYAETTRHRATSVATTNDRTNKQALDLIRRKPQRRTSHPAKHTQTDKTSVERWAPVLPYHITGIRPFPRRIGLLDGTRFPCSSDYPRRLVSQADHLVWTPHGLLESRVPPSASVPGPDVSCLVPMASVTMLANLSATIQASVNRWPIQRRKRRVWLAGGGGPIAGAEEIGKDWTVVDHHEGDGPVRSPPTFFSERIRCGLIRAGGKRPRRLRGALTLHPHCTWSGVSLPISKGGGEPAARTF